MARSASERRSVSAHPPSRSDSNTEIRLSRLERLLERVAEKLDVVDGEASIRNDGSDRDNWASGLSPEEREALRRMPEPRRQRKQRHLASRKKHRSRRATTVAQIHALQQLTPAGAQVFAKIAQHPKGISTADIAAALDLKKKTVDNLLTMLRKANLLEP